MKRKNGNGSKKNEQRKNDRSRKRKNRKSQSRIFKSTRRNGVDPFVWKQVS